MIADRLKMLMGDMSAREFAQKLGKNPSTVHEYLKGRMIPLDFAVHVCGCFGCNLDWLATGKEVVAELQEQYGPEKLSVEDSELLKYFRQLCPDQKRSATEMVRGLLLLAERSEKRGNPDNDSAGSNSNQKSVA